LDAAHLREKTLKSKDASRAAEAALHEYNDAVAARVAEILARIGALNEELGLNTSSPSDPRGEKGKTPDAKTLAEYESLQSELADLTSGPLSPGNVNTTPETEPNNTAGTANPLAVPANGCAVATGAITAGDIDFWSFTAPAGSRVWAYVDTGGGQSSPANDRDSFLTLFDSTPAIIEEDDDDGTGNGCDSDTESGFASNIAGRTLVAGGTYYLAVKGFGPTSVINPYKLFVVVTTAAPPAEVEPNDTAATANTILGAGQTVGTRSATVSPASNVDFYSVQAAAGDVFFISGDGNPERDATNTDLIIQFHDPGGRDLLTPAADSGLGGSATNPEGESFCIVAVTAGTYYVSVRGFATSTGTYNLMVARCPTTNGCVTEFTGILGQNSAEKPGVSGTQNGRLNRFVDQNGACNNVRTCPGLFTTVGARPFDAYTFTNGGTAACVTVDIDAQGCLGNNFLVVAAYLGPYDPTNQCLNYLADIGGSPNPIGAFSFNVPASATFTLVITAANASPTVCTTPYRVTVLGLFDAQPPVFVNCPLIVTTAAASSCPIATSSVVNFPVPTAIDNCQGVGTLYGASRSGQLYTINLASGAGTLVGQLPGPGSTEIEYNNITGRAFTQFPDGVFEGQEFSINNGVGIGSPVVDNGSFTGLEWVGSTLYGTVIFGPGGPSELRTLNPTTGASTLIGSTGIGPISGLAYNGTMYGITGGAFGGASDLVTVNLATGVATVIGSVGFNGGSLEFGPDGNLYGGATGGSSNLYRINPLSGASTLVGSTGFLNVTGLTLASNQVPVICTPASGSTLPVGCTTVTCTATDTSGNVATCTFQVCVFSFCLQDETNPGSVVLVNVQTGDYIFCCNGVFVASGRGVVTTRGCQGTLEDNKGNRKVELRWDTSVNGNRGRGTATLKIGTEIKCFIQDPDMSDNNCVCSP
jgi:hypothetical protein